MRSEEPDQSCFRLPFYPYQIIAAPGDEPTPRQAGHADALNATQAIILYSSLAFADPSKMRGAAIIMAREGGAPTCYNAATVDFAADTLGAVASLAATCLRGREYSR